MCLGLIRFNLYPTSNTQKSTRTANLVHAPFTDLQKTFAYHKVRVTSKPCFSGEYPERFIFLIFYTYIYIYRSLHVAYNDTRNHLGRCHSVPCKKKYTREILNITWGRPVRQAQLHRCSRFCTTRRRPKHKKQEFTRCFYKLLAKGDYYIFKHLSSIRLDFPDAVCRGFNWIQSLATF